MKIFRAAMLLAATLAWLNAGTIAANGVWVAAGTQALLVSLAVALVYALVGGLQFKMQQHLFRLWAAASATGSAAHPSLSALTRFSGVFSMGIALFMLLSLSAISSRISEGFAIFG